MSATGEVPPWRDGNYRGEGLVEAMVVTGDTGMVGKTEISLRHGDFGQADPEVAEVSGEQVYTVQMSWTGMAGEDRVHLAVLADGGQKFYFKSNMKTTPVGYLSWQTQEEADLLANTGDPIGAPPSPYPLEPERQGKLLFIHGAPGLGKSTTAQLLSRLHGWVYYEGDCFFSLRNPYVPADVSEPSLAQMKQRKLVGEGSEERRQIGETFRKEFIKRLEVTNHCTVQSISGWWRAKTGMTT